MREKILGRAWTWPVFCKLVGIWRGHDKDQAKSLDDAEQLVISWTLTSGKVAQRASCRMA